MQPNIWHKSKTGMVCGNNCPGKKCMAFNSHTRLYMFNCDNVYCGVNKRFYSEHAIEDLVEGFIKEEIRRFAQDDGVYF